MGISTGGSGSRTYKYYKNEFGAPLFRFGTGLNYVRFSLQPVRTDGGQQEGTEEDAVAVVVSERTVISTQKNDTFTMRVANHGAILS